MDENNPNKKTTQVKVVLMAKISAFDGIRIYMYQDSIEHNPPHFHIFFDNKEGSINILTGELLAGTMPKGKRMRTLKKWCTVRKKELLNAWNNQDFSWIDPLE